MTLKELREKRVTLWNEMKTISDTAENENRDLTAEEQERWDKHNDEIDALAQRIERAEHVETVEARMAESAGRKADAERPDPSQGQPEDRDSDDDLAVEFRGERLALDDERYREARDRATPEYRATFGRFLADGERRDLLVGKDPSGGYLAPPQFVARLIQALDDAVVMRRLGTVLPPIPNGVSVGFPSLDSDPADPDWTAEVPASDLTPETQTAFGKRELEPHLLTKLVKMSTKLLRASVLNVEALIRERLNYKFAIVEENAFLTGNGAQQPLGIFTASSDGISTSRDKTAASSTDFTGDELIDLLYALKPQYQARSTWLLHRDAVKMARKLKDGDGQYIWQPGLRGDATDLLLNRPVVQSENAPNTFTTGQYVAMVADFSWYWIVDSLSMQVQRLDELFALTNQIGFVGRKETDGMPVLEGAFSRLKLA